MPPRTRAVLPALLAVSLLAACTSPDGMMSPGVDEEARTAMGTVVEDAIWPICGVPMRVQTTGKIKPTYGGVIAFPQTTVRLTNTITQTSLTIASSGTLKYRVENGIGVIDLRGRNVLVQTTKGTAWLYVGTFTERVNAQDEGVITGIGHATDLCPQLLR